MSITCIYPTGFIAMVSFPVGQQHPVEFDGSNSKLFPDALPAGLISAQNR
jgi:hypothetical protein